MERRYLEELVEVCGTAFEIGGGFVHLKMLEELADCFFALCADGFSVKVDFKIGMTFSFCLFNFEHSTMFPKYTKNSK